MFECDYLADKNVNVRGQTRHTRGTHFYILQTTSCEAGHKVISISQYISKSVSGLCD